MLQNRSYYKGSPEQAFFEAERDKVLSGELGAKLNELTNEINQKQTQYNEMVELNKQRADKIQSLTNTIKQEMDIDKQSSKFETMQEIDTFHEFINQFQKIHNFKWWYEV